MKSLLKPCLILTSALSSVFAADKSTDSSDLKVTVLGYTDSATRRGVIVRFQNNTSKPLKLLRPLDGSEWGWHMPIYDLSVTDSSGKAIPLGGRCGMSGLYSNMDWPEDYRIQILPGDAYEMTVDMAREYPLTGRFTVCLRYTYDTALMSRKQNSSIKYPTDLWVGSVTSSPVVIEIPKHP